MLNLLGEYDCKLDAKGRLMMPSGLKKQLQEIVHEGFVMNRDLFEKCLILYPMSEWNRVSKEIGNLNRFVRKNVLFIRRFNNGATPVDVDSNGRILIPSVLSNYADMSKEIKVIGNGDRVELWSKENYDAMLSEDIDMASLSEEVMGGRSNEGEGE